MTRLVAIIIWVLALAFPAAAAAQAGGGTDDAKPEDTPVDMDNPTFVPTVKVGKVLVDGDSLQYVELNNVYVYPQPTFKNANGAPRTTAWWPTLRRCCR